MSKANQIKAIRGMNDLLPSDSEVWQAVEAVCAEVLQQYGYAQIRTPIIESTDLFARSIGADTDIVSKEMYTFEDRNGDMLTLRPEGTASCVRAGIENGLFYNQQQRLWYSGPMFRHERPQKGRYRQFHQIGAECYGWTTPDIDAELLSLIASMFDRLGLKKTELQINSLGDGESRKQYREALVEYLSEYKEQLDEDSQRRLDSNPLRILDSKNATTQSLLQDAPSILDFLSEESTLNFNSLQEYLNELSIPFTVNPRLVRGLDYYNDTVFEWVCTDYGAQSTVCGGGRYDGLVEQLGGQSTPGIGLGMGMERLVQILQEQQASSVDVNVASDVYIVSSSGKARAQALILQKGLCARGVAVNLYCGDAGFKNQFKRADRSGAKLALIIGEEEAQEQEVSIKPLRVELQDQINRQLNANSDATSVNEQAKIAQIEALIVVTNLLESL